MQNITQSHPTENKLPIKTPSSRARPGIHLSFLRIFLIRKLIPPSHPTVMRKTSSTQPLDPGSSPG
jgi:hypothetical protein